MAEDSKCADLNAEQANAIFEAIGKLYYARYGRLRPGKDDRLRDSMDEENIRQFSQWIKYEALDDAVMCIERLQRERDDFHEDNEVLRLRVERLQREVDVWKSKAVHRGKSASRLRAGLKQISASMAQAEGLQKIARDALRLADEMKAERLGGRSAVETSAVIDPNICGDDGPITAEDCALWLDNQYRRNHELEDHAAAMWLRKLSASAITAVETSAGYMGDVNGPGCDLDTK